MYYRFAGHLLFYRLKRVHTCFFSSNTIPFRRICLILEYFFRQIKQLRLFLPQKLRICGAPRSSRFCLKTIHRIVFCGKTLPGFDTFFELNETRSGTAEMLTRYVFWWRRGVSNARVASLTCYPLDRRRAEKLKLLLPANTTHLRGPKIFAFLPENDSPDRFQAKPSRGSTPPLSV